MRAASDRGWTLSMLAAAALLAACDTDVVRLDGRISPTQPKPECVSVPQSGGIQCVYCGADYSTQRACLKCQALLDSGKCLQCAWSDQDPTMVCKECTDESGAVSTVGCTELREDLKVPGT